ncbi:TerB family tellurite resistance protein [Helicobacter sp. 23-1045]
MEILLLIIAGGVLYMLYNSFSDYMKNPYNPMQSKDLGESFRSEYKPEDSPYEMITDEDKIKKGEFGILTQILANVARSDGEVCALERELIKDMLDDMADEINQYKDYKDARGGLQSIFDNASDDLDALASAFVEATKGEYKKRVKVVEFLFALAYADGILSEAEREKIIDVAAIFELNNDDFNKIYDDFEAKFAQGAVAMSKKKAMEVLGLNANFTRTDLENAYHSAIKAKKQNIFKSLNKQFDNEILREIDSAYKVLGESLVDSAKIAESSADSSVDSSGKIAESSVDSAKSNAK